MKKVLENINSFEPSHIFDCGQCFRWVDIGDGVYEGVAKGRILKVYMENGKPVIEGCTEEDFESIWRDYFDLDRDYAGIKERLGAGDPVVAKAIEYGSGIRILKQDLWETIVSFIISQNNNIPRIRGCVERLADGFGEPVGLDDSGVLRHSLPSVEKLASLEPCDLAEVRLGYRAPYLVKAAREVMERGMPYDYESVLALTGVGPKVASCISLFGLGDISAFPIDVWVRRLMDRLYGIPENDTKAMKAFAEEHFGDLGGIAQQYLFYYIRETSR